MKSSAKLDEQRGAFEFAIEKRKTTASRTAMDRPESEGR
jgi:hypothetical protein